MKKLYTSIVFTFLGLLLAFNISAQPNYTTTTLPSPDNLSPFFAGSIVSSKIYYGAQPDNSADKPVLVFVHGFIDLANSWFIAGNEMYGTAYDNGYRTAFVATTRGQGMWANGEILASMLEDITAHYGVDDVVIVAHSNGGKASEVAMFYEGKKDLVNRVISLGTPFYGTELADLSQTFLFRWLVDFIGLGGGASTSTTYYMGGLARPYLDNLYTNEPNKFFNFGAWGWNNGSTIAAPTMFVGGGILNVNGSGASQGGNDGVTPYWSSTRPGGLAIWPGYGHPNSRYDHIDVTMDYLVWDDIQPYFTNPLGTFRTTNESVNYKKEILSKTQYLSSETDMTTFTIEEGAKDISITFLHTTEEDQFTLKNINNAEARIQEMNVMPAEGYLKMFGSTAQFKNLEAGQYEVESDMPFAAIINYENGVTLQYTSDLTDEKLAYTEGETINLNAALLDTEIDYSDASITAIVTLTSDLKGLPVEEKTSIVELDFSSDNTFSTALKGFEAGVYNVIINAQHDDFTRTIVTGFAVQESEVNVEIAASLNETIQLKAFPNPIVDVTTIDFEITTQGDNYLRLYNSFGRLIQEVSVADLPVGQHQVSWNFNDWNLTSGTYFIEIQQNNLKQVLPVSKVK